MSTDQASHDGSLLDTHGYASLNIDIPLDTRTSLSMELTHDGTDESDSETVRASPQSPRKSIPPQWKPKPTQPRAPKFQTDLRKEEREKRKATDGNTLAHKPLRNARSLIDLKSRTGGATFLTKDAIEAIGGDITANVHPSSPKNSQRTQSKAGLHSPYTSPVRSSPREQPTMKVTLSPVRNARADVQESGRASSVVSTTGTEYHSAHSSVSHAPSRVVSRRSSRDTFHSATDLVEDKEEISQLYLTGADGAEQKKAAASPSISHSRSKTDPHAKLPTTTGQRKLIRPAVPNIALRVRDGKPPFPTASASSSGPGSPVSPTRSSSRIPRTTSTFDMATKASTLKRSQSAKALKETKANVQQSILKGGEHARKLNIARITKPDGKEDAETHTRDVPSPKTPIAEASTRHVRTLNSTGTTPIMAHFRSTETNEQPDVHAMVTEYLDNVDLNARPDHTPFTEDVAKGNETSFVETITTMLSGPKQPTTDSSERSSRTTSMSTVKAAVLEDPVLNDPAIVYSGKKVDSSGIAANVLGPSSAPSRGSATAESSSGVQDDALKPRCRSDQCVPQERKKANNEHSRRFGDLRATAPEFVPQPQDDLKTSTQHASNTPWTQPINNNLLFDPFCLDIYGMPWFYHMYPVYMNPSAKFSKKGRSGRKRGDRATSPKKYVRSALSNEEQPSEGHDEAQQEADKDSMTAFATQLEEIALNAAVRKSKESQNPSRRGHMTMPARTGRPHRNVGNGLYDSFGRGGFHSMGMPIEETAPFPNPVAPTGRNEYVGYTIEPTQDGCGVVDIERAAEWGGSVCNRCEPDH